MEFAFGTEGEFKEQYEMVMKFPEMEHADSQTVPFAPGKTGEGIWQFTKAGKIDLACRRPGHCDAGMKGIVSVAAGKATTGTKGEGRRVQALTVPKAVSRTRERFLLNTVP